MNRTLLALISILLLNSNPTFSQESDWSTSNFLGRRNEEKVSKTEGYITFTVDSVTGMIERNDIVEKTKKYIAHNIELIGESELTDSIDLVLVRDKDGMEGMKQFKFPSASLIKGEQGIPINLMMSAYSEKRDAIKGEMMSMIVKLKWGLPEEPTLKWLSEGLVTLADPDMNTCDGYTLEERYVCFLQNDRLLDKNILLQFENVDTMPQLKIAQNQSAYIVEYLLKKYGVEKIKSVYQKGMDSFEEIYGFSFEKMIENINGELSRKYPNPIDFNRESFEKECFLATIYADWHPLYLKRYEQSSIPMESKMEGNIRYTVPLTMNIDMRNEAIAKTGEYITECLELINESEFKDSIHMFLVENRNQMKEYFEIEFGGLFSLKSDYEYDYEHILYSVCGGRYSPLKHELMHAVNLLKWDTNLGVPEWLVEGFAVFANPETYSCDGHALEEKYVYFLQNDKLLELKNLLRFPETHKLDKLEKVIANKTSYCQSGYIVSYLYEIYGVEKLKTLWMNESNNEFDIASKGHKKQEELGTRLEADEYFALYDTYWMDSFSADFESIYGITFNTMIEEINATLNEKYPDPIDFNWKAFSEKSCIE